LGARNTALVLTVFTLRCVSFLSYHAAFSFPLLGLHVTELTYINMSKMEMSVIVVFGGKRF